MSVNAVAARAGQSVAARRRGRPAPPLAARPPSRRALLTQGREAFQGRWNCEGGPFAPPPPTGCAAPLPSAARRGVLLWGSLALLALRALALYVVQAAMAEEEGAAAFAQMGLASALPSVCAALLGASALLSAAFVATQLALGCCRQFGVEGPPRPAAKPKPKPPSKAEEEAAAAADAAAAAERLAAASAGAAAALAIALEEGTNGRPAAKPKPKPKAGKKPKAKAAEMV